jgi:broad specificity phosphatase PhoE
MSDVLVSMLLARHGETPDNAAGLILGRRDPAL